ncbi:hypothetical protein D1007_40327 [Hordeum vulgare]|nr:hypothetical protein D1007_40327 [Hordeum vulgare]
MSSPPPAIVDHGCTVKPSKASKYGRTDETIEASSAQRTLPTTSVPLKQKEQAKGPREMSLKEFWAFRHCNPYGRPKEPSFVNRPFWTREQTFINMDVVKAKKNLYVDAMSIDLAHLEKDPAYYGEAIALCH